MTAATLNVAVFASGSGTNFQALVDHQAAGGAPWRIAVLICNRDAAALERARVAGVEAVVLPTRDRPAHIVAAETLSVLEAHAVDVIALAGYLRLLPPEVVRSYRGRIVNVHPALLPDFGGEGMYGMNVHRAVLAAGVHRSGASVHFVDERYDEGAVIARWSVPVHAADTADELAARVLRVEHQLYPLALDHLCRALAAGRAVEPMETRHIEDSPVPVEEER